MLRTPAVHEPHLGPCDDRVSAEARVRASRGSARGAPRGSGAFDEVGTDQSAKPGLYAFYATVSTWNNLGLGDPPDDRPLYVGKAENTFGVPHA